MHLYEKTLDSVVNLDGKIIKVTTDTVELENGEIAFREVVHHNGGVCIVPITEDDEIIFVKQFRYPFKEVILEVPAGKIDKGEDHYDCGKRELLEETGAVASEFTYIGVMYPTTGYVTEKIHMYYAKGLTFTKQKLDEDEFLDVVKIPFDKALEMIINNDLPDAKTQISILKTARLLGK